MGDVTSKEIRIDGASWRKNGGKIMRMINERIGDDSYKIRFKKLDKKVNDEMFETIVTFFDVDDAYIYKVIANRKWHGK